MVVVLSRSITQTQKAEVKEFLEQKGYLVREIVGQEETIFGAVGLAAVDAREVELLPGVDRVIPITKPYKLASREFKQEDTIIQIGNVKIGGPRVVVIAGPCAVESRELILETARAVRESGAVMLRGGVFKPRTSPYSFQGLGFEALEYLKEAGEKEGMPVVTEILSTEHLAGMLDYVDVFQIGARNMQNYELLKKVGASGKPVLLKRGLAATIQEWLMAAEYLLASGTENVILCERGIRTFETYTRNTLDISAIPVVKKLSHLPIIVDPSHATGIRAKVPPMALAAIAAGADGVVVEVHPNPDKALSDGPQSLYPDQLEKLIRDLEALSPVIGKELEMLPRQGRSFLIPLELSQPEGKAGTVNKQSKGKSESDQFSCAFQGERGAFSELAMAVFFNKSKVAPEPFRRFEEVFTSVLTGKSDYGILPLENSLAGSIHENYDLLLQYPDIKIVGEKKIRIIHSLLGLPGTSIHEIRKVFSHPQGLAQCARFLDTLKAEPVPYYDTAGSAAFVSREGNRELAAIAGSETADIYGLSVLKEGIETNPKNYTRFAVIARVEHPEQEDWDKASLVFATADKPGSLFECLAVLSKYHLNMRKLESRPILGKPWQYMFYVDVEVPRETEIFQQALPELKKVSQDLRVLGVYKAD